MSLKLQNLPEKPDELEAWISKREKSGPPVKDCARANIVWNEPQVKEKTDYSLVYLHGFKASHGEGNPVHKHVAAKFGMNLYLSRLEGHGLNISEPFKNLSVNSFTESALGALAIGEKIGDKVIIMGTSTGASLGLYLASIPELKKNIAGLVLYSPLIKFYGINRWILGHEIIRQLVAIIPGSDFTLRSEPGSSEEERKIWYESYALQGALALGKLIQNTMTENTFTKVTCPTFTGFYYKSKEQQDKVVSVKAIMKMHEKIGVENDSKVLKNFPNAGTHVIGSGLLSGSIESLKMETCRFIKDKIINKAQQPTF